MKTCSKIPPLNLAQFLLELGNLKMIVPGEADHEYVLLDANTARPVYTGWRKLTQTQLLRVEYLFDRIDFHPDNLTAALKVFNHNNLTRM
jgi:hypothetical protein